MNLVHRADEQDTLLEGKVKMPTKNKTATLKSCVLVMGMRHSGGTTLATVLGMLGCDLPGKSFATVSHEPPEDPVFGIFHDFNDKLLAASGSSRLDLKPLDMQWLDSPHTAIFLDQAVELLAAEFGNSPLFVIEDPISCRLFPFWLEALERFDCVARPMLVTCNPVELSRILHSELGLTEAHGQIMWLRHMLDAEIGTRGVERFLTSIDLLTEHWDIVAQDAQQKFNISWPRPIANIEFDVKPLIERAKMSQAARADRSLKSPLVAEWVRESYEIFDRWARDGESPSDYPALDRVRTQLDAGAQAFSRLLDAEREQILHFRAGLDTLPRLQKERDEASALLSEKLAECDELTQELQEHRRQATLLDAELFRQRDELAILAQLAARNEDRVVQMNADKDELKKKLFWEREQKELITQDIERIRRMFSWRITAPLRKAGRLFRPRRRG